MKNLFGSFKKAGKVIEDAKKDVRRKPKDEVAEQHNKKSGKKS